MSAVASITPRPRAGNAEQLGPYIVYERLGMGGMATVHRAETRGTAQRGKPVAVKRLLSHLHSDPDAVKAFIFEAKLASHLHHTNVVQVFDFGKIDDDYFIAMEYIAGPTLKQIMGQCTAAAGAMPLPIVISILCQICDALDHAHNLCDKAGRPLGIIHRDVSPSNIIVSSAGIVKLIDFGIAKAATGALTQAGIIKGKFAYLAPEYTLGQLDLRADLFALGVIAHELLTGLRLFGGDNDYETILQLREMPIQPPSRWNAGVSRELDDIVMTALHRVPDQRWQNARAMRNALTNAANEFAVAVRPHQLSKWVEWAFSQLPRREDTALLRAIDTLEDPTRALRVRRVGVSAPSQPPARTGTTVLASRPQSASLSPLLLLLFITIAAAAYYRGLLVSVGL